MISESELVNAMKYVRLGVKDCEADMNRDKAKALMAVKRASNPAPSAPRKKRTPKPKQEAAPLPIAEES